MTTTLQKIYAKIFDNGTKKINAKSVRDAFAIMDDKIEKVDSGLKGVLKISDPKPAPDAVGKYELVDIGEYTNLVPIIPFGDTEPQNTPITTHDRFYNAVYWDGVNFIQIKNYLGQNISKINSSDERNINSIAVEKYLGINNLLTNSSFQNGLTDWNKNDPAIDFEESGDYVSINTHSVADPAIYQTDIPFEIGNYIIEAKVQKTSSGSSDLKMGVIVATASVTISDTDWHIVTLNLTFTGADTRHFIFNPLTNTQWNIEYIKFYKEEKNTLVEKTESSFNYSLSEINFSKGINVVFSPSDNKTNISIAADTFVFDALGGYRRINAGIYEVPVENTAYLSKSASSFEEPDFTKKGTGEILYIWSERYDTTRKLPRRYSLGTSYYDWKAFHPAFSLSEASAKNWMPKKSNGRSPYFDKLKPFFTKMQLRNQDVTLVQIGDSISTDLNWTDKRPDANQRPPFCTEYNINSYLEEKLRWKEQKYRRFDYAGIFTELGTGTSTVMDQSADWYLTGSSYQLPVTKVIDGGSNNGVSFKMPAGTRRLSLIVHTDKNWATSTQVSISEGNGKVEVWNGTAWVEANGYSTSFKETLAIPTRTEIRDNPHVRLKFRSLNDSTNEKTITVQNVGAGRFGYWGIEYSPKEFMFTYICASKGSHNIEMLRMYESYTVDAFNPDLVLQQCCILNQQVGQGSRIRSPQDFADIFDVYYDALEAKDYLVFPYILWAATYSYFIDENGNFLSGYSSNSEKEFTCFDDVNYLTKMYEDKGAPNLNLFGRITEAGLEKAKEEIANLYTAAMNGSGKSGNTFTIDGIHLNKTGNDVCWAMLEEYFNY